MADRPDEVVPRVSADRSAGLGPVQLPDAFLAGRPDDSGKELAGPDAQEIFVLLVAHLPDVARLKLEKFPSPYPALRLGRPRLGVALAVRRVLEPSPQVQHPASPLLDGLSDVQLSKAVQTELLLAALGCRSVQRPLALPSFPLERAREQPVPQALLAMAQLLARPVSAQLRPEPLPGQGARSLLWLPRSSRLRLQLPPQPDQGNVFALARRARYQSSSSASSSL